MAGSKKLKIWIIQTEIQHFSLVSRTAKISCKGITYCNINSSVNHCSLDLPNSSIVTQFEIDPFFVCLLLDLVCLKNDARLQAFHCQSFKKLYRLPHLISIFIFFKPVCTAQQSRLLHLQKCPYCITKCIGLFCM